jgi:alpha-tubulin suppressor-like RCC1 family protein
MTSLPWRAAFLLVGAAAAVALTMAALVLAATPEVEAVLWTNNVGVAITGTALTKTAPTGWGNAGASSTRGIASGDGYAEFTVPVDPGYSMFGLGFDDTSQGYDDIDFAFYTYPVTGQLMAYEKGVHRGSFGPYASGDVLRISTESGTVRYWRNGALLYTSGATPAYPLAVDTALHSVGGTVEEAVLSGTLVDVGLGALPREAVLWTNRVGVSAGPSALTKTAANGWGNAGASSTRGIASGDGYAEFTVPATAGYAMFGLSYGDTDQSYGDIDFAFYTYPPAGQIFVYEKGVYRRSLGAYASGDVLRVSVESGQVKYWRNSVLLAVSGETATYPLLVDTALYSAGAVVQGAVLAGTLVDAGLGALPSEAVVWANAAGVSIGPTTLTKTAATAWGNAGASSTRAIASGDGYAEFTVPATAGYAMVGLSDDDADWSYGDIDFAFYAYPGTGQLMVYEKGVHRGSFGLYASGDALRISVEAGQVRYRRNGDLLYASDRVPAYPLLVDTALYSEGAAVEGAVLGGTLVDVGMAALPREPVVWTNEVGVSAGSATLVKTATTAWGNAGASSTRAIASADGYAEFTLPPSPGYAMFGLGSDDASQRHDDIDFAFYTYGGTGQLLVYEKGVSRGSFGPYASGDVLRVEVKAGQVRYSRNGLLLYASGQLPALPLRVDTSLYSSGAVVHNATLAGALVDVPEQAGAPAISPPGGTFVNAVEATVTAQEPDDVVWYTTDGSPPTEASPVIESAGTLLVDRPMTIRARAWRSGASPSEEATAVFALVTAAPVANPPSGTYAAPLHVGLSSETAGALVHCTTDGTEPTADSETCAELLRLSADTVVKAMAQREGWPASATVTGSYTVTAPAGAVSAGSALSLALGPSGALWAWGYGGSGQLGNGETLDQPTPVGVPGVVDATAVSAGAEHVLALRADGTVLAWGHNGYGQVGTGAAGDPVLSPVAIGLSDVVAVAAGGYHSLALRADGHVYAWGANDSGQLGSGTTDGRAEPGLVANLESVVAIAAGAWHSLALKTDGTVVSWGYNAFGELGRTTDSGSTPGAVSGLSGITRIASGPMAYHSFAVAADGVAYAWGANWSGQLGDGTTETQTLPVAVVGLTDVARVSAGGSHSLAAREDGSLWAWGDNSSGQVGTDGAGPTTPTMLASPADVIAVAAGSTHSLVLTRDGRVFAWGGNASGQVGMGAAGAAVPSPFELSGSEFQWRAATPVVTPPGGPLSGDLTVTITSPIPGATGVDLMLDIFEDVHAARTG